MRCRPEIIGATAALALVVAALTVVADPADDAQARYQNVREQAGQSCALDRQCLSPLRCFDDVCAEPPAIVGSDDPDSPMVLFYGTGGEVIYRLEVVDQAWERQRGLMHRPSMLDDWGMLFVYPSERPLSFWMQNTYIPLDMVFLDDQLRVVGVVANAEPLTTTSRAVEGESRYVIEINAGQAALHGIEAGVRTELLNLSADVLAHADD